MASWYLLLLMVPARSLFFSFSIRIRNGQGRSRRVSVYAARDVSSPNPPANSSSVLATGARGHTGDSLSMLTNVRYENEKAKERKRCVRRERAFLRLEATPITTGSTATSSSLVATASEVKPFFCIISMTRPEYIIYTAAADYGSNDIIPPVDVHPGIKRPCAFDFQNVRQIKTSLDRQPSGITLLLGFVSIIINTREK